MEFELHFRNELKRLTINVDGEVKPMRRYDVCKILDCTMPTLTSKIRNPGTLTVNDITKLNNAGFEINRVIYSLTNN